MHYELKQKTDGVFELGATFIDEDYDSFLKRFHNLSVFEVNKLWFEFKAKIIHDIGTTFCQDQVLWITINDALFPQITYNIDMKGHIQCFDDCAGCPLKEYFATEFFKYDADLEQMLNMVDGNTT